MQGKIIGWNAAKQTGVITTASGQRLMFRVSDWQHGAAQMPQAGAQVEFDADQDRARNVRVTVPAPAPAAAPRPAAAPAPAPSFSPPPAHTPPPQPVPPPSAPAQPQAAMSSAPPQPPAPPPPPNIEQSVLSYAMWAIIFCIFLFVVAIYLFGEVQNKVVVPGSSKMPVWALIAFYSGLLLYVISFIASIVLAAVSGGSTYGKNRKDCIYTTVGVIGIGLIVLFSNGSLLMGLLYLHALV